MRYGTSHRAVRRRFRSLADRNVANGQFAGQRFIGGAASSASLFARLLRSREPSEPKVICTASCNGPASRACRILMISLKMRARSAGQICCTWSGNWRQPFAGAVLRGVPRMPKEFLKDSLTCCTRFADRRAISGAGSPRASRRTVFDMQRKIAPVPRIRTRLRYPSQSWPLHRPL